MTYVRPHNTRARDKEVVYPAMHWCLQRLPQLKKRAYLARYLMPVEVPMEFMQDQALVDLHESYRQLQVSEAPPPPLSPRARFEKHKNMQRTTRISLLPPIFGPLLLPLPSCRLFLSPTPTPTPTLPAEEKINATSLQLAQSVYCLVPALPSHPLYSKVTE